MIVSHQLRKQISTGGQINFKPELKCTHCHNECISLFDGCIVFQLGINNRSAFENLFNWYNRIFSLNAKRFAYQSITYQVETLNKVIQMICPLARIIFIRPFRWVKSYQILYNFTKILSLIEPKWLANTDAQKIFQKIHMVLQKYNFIDIGPVISKNFTIFNYLSRSRNIIFITIRSIWKHHVESKFLAIDFPK